MEHSFLMTYLKNGKHEYEWFMTEEEMKNFAYTKEPEAVVDAIEVLSCRDVKLTSE